MLQRLNKEIPLWSSQTPVRIRLQLEPNYTRPVAWSSIGLTVTAFGPENEYASALEDAFSWLDSIFGKTGTLFKGYLDTKISTSVSSAVTASLSSLTSGAASSDATQQACVCVIVV